MKKLLKSHDHIVVWLSQNGWGKFSCA